MSKAMCPHIQNSLLELSQDVQGHPTQMAPPTRLAQAMETWRAWSTTIGLLLTVAVTLSIEPLTYTVSLTPDTENAQVTIVIEGNPHVNPYVEFNTFPLDEGASTLTVSRRRLPRGSYTIWAGVYRWVNCELVLFEASPTLTIHVP